MILEASVARLILVEACKIEYTHTGSLSARLK